MSRNGVGTSRPDGNPSILPVHEILNTLAEIREIELVVDGRAESVRSRKAFYLCLDILLFSQDAHLFCGHNTVTVKGGKIAVTEASSPPG